MPGSQVPVSPAHLQWGLSRDQEKEIEVSSEEVSEESGKGEPQGWNLMDAADGRLEASLGPVWEARLGHSSSGSHVHGAVKMKAVLRTYSRCEGGPGSGRCSGSQGLRPQHSPGHVQREPPRGSGPAATSQYPLWCMIPETWLLKPGKQYGPCLLMAEHHRLPHLLVLVLARDAKNCGLCKLQAVGEERRKGSLLAAEQDAGNILGPE
ncbi:hypothetical protein E5288_WYG017900 [Bos mutus]|uniref:Uncharacterized protein n=1 Tax=Bos mutus TaxID=72004 RepID=A0A6B0S386_9CETA|nr:hypothetical protein [Bos mutus]